MDYHIRIKAGRLSITTDCEQLPLRQLLDFGSRQNPRRGYLFVSKVLGKHIPCRPSAMREVYDRLAGQLNSMPGPVLVIGMAETATALGGGIADSLARLDNRNDVIYLHTTRHPLARSLWCRFDENHSHAPDHLLYPPPQTDAIRTLILVDDEISTGRTLQQLAAGVAGQLPALERIVMVSIVNWLDADQQAELNRDLTPAAEFVSLLSGRFDFTPDPDYRPMLPEGTEARQRGATARADSGRAGLNMPFKIGQLPTGPLPDGPLVVVGIGEYSFIPFLIAERLEQNGHDVLFQSTTRSPIAEGDAISSKLCFNDEYDQGISNYIYNLPADRQVIAVYESADLAARHQFPTQVGASVWIADPDEVTA